MLRVENAFALHFGRVRGQHRHDQRVIEELLQHRRGSRAGFDEPFQCIGDGARLRSRAGHRVDAVAAVAVPVFGDVREVGEVAERTYHAHGLLRAQRAQLLVERLRGRVVVFAAKAYGRLTDRLDDVEYRIAFLLAQYVAEQPAEVTDVLEERMVLVLTRAAIGLRGGAGWSV